MRLTHVQHDLLAWLDSTSGVIEIADERVVDRLIERGLALKFFETHNGDLRPVWTITDAGRAALKKEQGR